MEISEELKQLLSEGLAEVERHPRQHLSPATRLAIYKALEPTATPPAIRPIRGRLGVLTTQRVLPLWEENQPFWEVEEDEIDDNNLPDYLLNLANGVLDGTIDFNFAWHEANEYWYWVGNIFEEAAKGETLQLDNAYVCDVALKALLETLGAEFLGRLKGWDKLNDDKLSQRTFACDAACSAVIAYAGGGRARPVDLKKRREFWQWWLTEAIPQAIQVS